MSIPGLELAERFYHDAVRPLLDAHFPALPHAAALIGSGLEVLGFDTAVSCDHHWGPRAMLFLQDSDHARVAEDVSEMLRAHLPHTFLDWPTNFGAPEPGGVRKLCQTTSGRVDHMVEVLSLPGFFRGYLGFDLREPLTPADWLTFPSQLLRSIVSGAVFHDDIGLEAARARFAWYPHDVWLYLLAASWWRISEEEHLMGRAGQVGDEIGSALIGGRLVRDLMRLCFLMERFYAPYPKWYGTAFSRLAAAAPLKPLLWRALRAETWPERDRALGDAYGVVASLHNALALTDPLPTRPGPFDRRPGDHVARQLASITDRPFSVIRGERFASALEARIRDPQVRAIRLGADRPRSCSDSEGGKV